MFPIVCLVKYVQFWINRRNKKTITSLSGFTYCLNMTNRAITSVAYLKMKSLEAFRERQWNVIQVIVSDVKMLQFM